MKRETSGSALFMRISVAAFFILFGLVGIASYNSDLNRLGRAIASMFGGTGDVLSLVIAILALASGIVLLLGLFVRDISRYMSAAAWAVVVFWGLRIVYVFFANNALEPDALTWLEQLSMAVVILAAVVSLARRT